MVNYCCVLGCTSSTLTHPHFAFFSFPSDEERSKTWFKAIDLHQDTNNDKIDKTEFRICQLHFESNIFSTTTKLDNNAVPTLHLPDTIKISSRRSKQEQKAEIMIKEEPLDQPGTEAVADGCLQTTNYKQDDFKNYILFREKYSKLTTSPSEIISIEPESSSIKVTQWTCSTQTNEISLTQTNKNIKSKACQTAARLYYKATPKKLKNFYEICDQYLNENLAKLVKIQAHLKYKPKGNNYTKQYKSFCSDMYDRNPLVYRQFQKFLYLPSTRTLRREKHCLKHAAESGEENIEDNVFECPNTQETITAPNNTMEEDSAVNQDNNIATCSSNDQQEIHLLKRSYNTASADFGHEDKDNENNITGPKVKIIEHDPYYDGILNIILKQQSSFLKKLK